MATDDQTFFLADALTYVTDSSPNTSPESDKMQTSSGEQSDIEQERVPTKLEQVAVLVQYERGESFVRFLARTYSTSDMDQFEKAIREILLHNSFVMALGPPTPSDTLSLWLHSNNTPLRNPQSVMQLKDIMTVTLNGTPPLPMMPFSRPSSQVFLPSIVTREIPGEESRVRFTPSKRRAETLHAGVLNSL